MPNPHFDITITQRSKGQSAVAGAAYQSGEKLFSEYDQKTKNYTGKRGILYTEIMLPSHAPPEYANRPVPRTADPPDRHHRLERDPAGRRHLGCGDGPGNAHYPAGGPAAHRYGG